ncbi:MAG: PIN domain-containing protein [Desulfonauticus sp.]|nr:PIN domain-containing protein [Desulfonauticus sp.]
MEKLIFSRTSLFCSNYILVETLALVQRRLGMNAVKIFKDDVLSIIEIIWINENIHNEGMNLFISENKRKLSFVDCISFVTMKHYGINIAFTFDSHFFKEGFNCIP